MVQLQLSCLTREEDKQLHRWNVWTQSNWSSGSRLSDGRVLRHTKAVAGVGELWRSVAGHDAHVGRRASATVTVHRLHPQQVLLTGGQRSSRGPDLT